MIKLKVLNLMNKPKEKWNSSDYELKFLLSDQNVVNLVKKI